jgi:cytochrome P450
MRAGIATSSTTQVLAPKFDPADPFTIEHPYERYAQLRAAGPVCRAFLPGQLAVTHHAQVAALLADPRLGMEFTADAFAESGGALRSFFGNIVFEQHRGTHKRLRRFLNSAFSKPFLQRLLERIDAHIEAAVAPLLEREEFDAVRDLAAGIPTLMVGELLGIRGSALTTFDANARAFHALIDMRNVGNGEALPRAKELLGWLRAHCGEMLSARRQRPGDDLPSHLAGLVIGVDRLSDEEIVDNLIFLFFAGLDSSRDLIGTGFVALARFPDQWALLKADPKLVPIAVEEFLRYDAPIQMLARRALEPIEVAGRIVRPERVLWLLIGSANHDEQVFASPERVLVARRPNPHVTFGTGVHSCLAAHLARSVATMIFRRLVTRCRAIELVAEPTRHRGVESRSYEGIPIRVTPA